MNFLAASSSTALALLAGVALAVLGLYLLRPSARRIGISSNVIWSRVLKARKRDADRLRWWISLAVAALIALAVALAFTQPEWRLVSGGAKRLLVVVDNSVSLATRTQDGKTRWDHAVKYARGAIERAGAGSQFMVLDTLRQSGSPAWEKLAEALIRLDKLRPAVGTARFPMAPASPADGRTLDTLFIGDGVSAIQVPKGYRVHSVFESAKNLGITAFEVRAQPAGARKHAAYLEVFNASAGTEQAELTITGAHGRLIRQHVAIPGNSTASAVIDVSAFPPGAVRASMLSASDAYDADNTAFSFVPAKSVIRVALVTRGNAVLERALRLQPRLQLTLMSSPKLKEEDGFDAVVLDRMAPALPLPFPALMIRPERPAGLPASAGELHEATINIWDEHHPVMEHLSLRDVVVERAMKWQVADLTKARAVVLASDAAKGPLIVASAGDPRWVATTFDLSNSNLPLQAGFPVLLANTLQWLTGEPQALVRSPGLVEVPAPGGRVLGLDGKEIPVRAMANGIAFESPGAGFYTVVTADRVLRVAVNAFSGEMISVNRSHFAPHTEDSQQPAPRTRAEPWVLLLFVALALLSAEWMTYHRRITV
ncbi:MAG: hypothetical protein EXR36_05400 [Betaproteobacteria bacterium]|nr:hypothetical protein [Betaproteobacteria bacterium]